MTILQYARISLIIAFMAVSVSALSQSATSKEGPKGDLEILAVMNSPSVCVGTDHLSVRIMITNKSKEPLQLDVSGLSTTIGFVALIDTAEMKFRTQTLGVNGDPVGKPIPAATTVLLPNSFFEREIQLPIRDPFFSQAGYYRLNLSSSVRVGQPSHPHDVFSSSSAIFELRACE
jgi:hypothetical protein